MLRSIWITFYRCRDVMPGIACLLGATCVYSADDLEDFRVLITTGIANNLASIRSFEAEVVEFEESSFGIGRNTLQRRQINKMIVFDGTRWRQRIVTSITDIASGKQVPYHTDSVFDGDKTLRFSPLERAATVKGGNAMESTPSQDLGSGYTFWDWPLPGTLRFATAIRKIVSENGANTRNLVEVTLRSPEPPNHVTTLWLDGEAGFLIIKAVSHDEAGRLIRERRGTETAKAAGAWFLSTGVDELWDFASGVQRTLERRSWKVSLTSVNEPIPGARFDVVLPPRTLVVDYVLGRTGTIERLGRGTMMEGRPRILYVVAVMGTLVSIVAIVVRLAITSRQ